MPLKHDDGGLRKYINSLPGAAGFLAIEGGVQAQSQVVLRHIKKNPGFTPRQAVGGLLDSFKVRKTSQKSRALTGAGQALAFFNLVAERPAGSTWHLTEFGHKARDGSFVPAYPTVEPALIATAREQKVAFDKRVRKVSDRIAQRVKTGGLSKREQRYVSA